MIKTYLRLRPISLLEAQKSPLSVNGNSIEITVSNNKYNYEFDHVIDPNVSQESIFELVVCIQLLVSTRFSNYFFVY